MTYEKCFRIVWFNSVDVRGSLVEQGTLIPGNQEMRTHCSLGVGGEAESWGKQA